MTKSTTGQSAGRESGEGYRLGDAGAALIRRFESCGRRRRDGKFEAYPDPATGGDPWTIGWGSTGADVKRGTIWTQDECNARFDQDADRFAAGVARLVSGVPTTQNQFDALVSFAYNLGIAALAGSSLLRLHRAGDHAAAAAQFARWNRAAGRVLAGLTRRRAAEAALYEAG